MPFILLGLVAVLIAAVIGLALVVVLRSDDDDAASPATKVSTTTASSAPASDSTSPPTESTAPDSTTPTSAPSSLVTPSTEPPPPPSTTPVASSDELASAMTGYIDALGSGDIDAAYAYVAPSLRRQDGWDLDSFTAFRTDRISGAEVVSVDATSTSTGAVTATVDYFLRDGGVSRESVRATFAPAGDAGLLVMTDYEVLSSERRD